MIGVDPGGTYTGIVARPQKLHTSACLFACVVVREDGQAMVDYVLEVFDAIRDAVTKDRGPHAGEIAVEDVQPPTGWKAGERAPIDPTGLLGTARVLGAIEGRWPNRHLVAPGGHGALPLELYPKLLRGPRERVGTGRRRHARSAWDIAGVALAHPDPAQPDPDKVTEPPNPEDHP